MYGMVPFYRIQTHPGSAHRDEFVACCLLLTEREVEIVRRETTPEELSDPGICVVDIGHCHESARNIYDHHQRPRSEAPACSVSLVLEEMGLYEDAREYCDWLETMEWFDSRGLVETAHWLGVEPKALRRLQSPIEGALLRAFSSLSCIPTDHFLWTTMKWIGEDIRNYLESLRERLRFIETHGTIWSCGKEEPFDVFFLPRTEPLPEDPGMGIGRFIEGQGWKERVVGMIYPDRRGAGYGLSRFNDDRRLDFLRLRGLPDVHFAHANGFLAKTTASQPERLRELMHLAWHPEGAARRSSPEG